jgi:hypothetical protein
MPLPVSSEIIAERLREYPRDNYLYIGSIIKGVALGIAAIALLALLPDLRHAWPQLITWLCSLAAILVSYMTWGRGILVTNSRSNVGDTIFPLGMGILEFLLFGILWPDTKHPWFWLNWFAVLGIHALFAVFLTHNRLNNSVIDEDFNDDLRDLGLLMEKWIREDRIGASCVAGGALAFWVIVRWIVTPLAGIGWGAIVQSILAVPAIAVLIVVICKANKERMTIDKVISEKERVRLGTSLTKSS